MAGFFATMGTQTTEASEACRRRLEAQIANGLGRGRQLLEQLEAERPTDALVPGRELTFGFDGSLFMQDQGQLEVGLTRHAFSQVCEKAGVPFKYIDGLLEGKDDWGAKLGCNILHEHFSHKAGRYLVRTVKDTARGFLSDKFKRIDSRPCLDVVLSECEKLGILPIEGTVTETQARIKMVIPKVFEPVPGEPVAIYAEWSNSDYGLGKHRFNLGMERLACFNGMMGRDDLNQVHLGRRLDEGVVYSPETIGLDTRASVSALRDAIPQVCGKERSEGMLGAMTKAYEQGLTWAQAKGRLGKTLLKTELEEAQRLYCDEKIGTEYLPKVENVWRLANAVSLMAKEAEPDRAVDLEKLAGRLMGI